MTTIIFLLSISINVLSHGQKIPMVTFVRHSVRQDCERDPSGQYQYQTELHLKKFSKCDTRLNVEKGYKSARDAAKEIETKNKDFKIDYIVTSPFQRCLETSSIIAYYFNITDFYVNIQIGEVSDAVQRFDGPLHLLDPNNVLKHTMVNHAELRANRNNQWIDEMSKVGNLISKFKIEKWLHSPELVRLDYQPNEVIDKRYYPVTWESYNIEIGHILETAKQLNKHILVVSHNGLIYSARRYLGNMRDEPMEQGYENYCNMVSFKYNEEVERWEEVFDQQRTAVYGLTPEGPRGQYPPPEPEPLFQNRPRKSAKKAPPPIIKRHKQPLKE